jgi:Flp pilus assembly protein TadG
MRLRSRAWITSRRGAAMVDTALVVPVFLFFVYGMIETSRLGLTAQLVTDAAREGCRVAVIDGMTQSNVDTMVQEVLNSGGITTYTSAITPGFSTLKLGNKVTLNISVNYSDVSWLAPPPYFGSTTICASATLNSERVLVP